jgi:hypothetical protein
MLELDIVAQLAPVPVDMRRRTVLVEIVIAEAGIHGKVDAVRTCSFLVALAELEELPTFFRHRDLAAAVVGHVAADHQAGGLADRGAGRGEAARRAGDLARPAHFGQPVQCGYVAPEALVGLAFGRAMRAEPAAHPAGVDVRGEDEGDVDGRRRAGRGRAHRAESRQAGQEGTPVENARAWFHRTRPSAPVAQNAAAFSVVQLCSPVG